MDLPKHPILELEEPVIFIDGNLFTSGPEKQRTNDYLTYRSKTFSLMPIGPLNVLDLLYYKRNINAFENYKRGVISQIKNDTLGSRDEVLREVCSNELLQLIVGRILPKMTGDKLNEDMDKLLGVSRQREEQDDQVETGSEVAKDILKELNIKNVMVQQGFKTLPELFESGSASVPNFANGPFYMADGNVYKILDLEDYLSEKLSGSRTSLRQIQNLPDGSTIDDYIACLEGMRGTEKLADRLIRRINGLIIRYQGNNYVLKYDRTKQEVREKFDSFFAGLLTVEAAHQYQDQLKGVEKKKQMKKEFKDLVGKQKYEKNNVGFEKTASGYYVYMNTGEYIIDYKGDKYKFPNARVAAHLSGDKKVTINPPVVLNSYSHMFLNDSGGSGQRICLGSFNLGTFANLSPEEKVIAYVSKGVEVLKYGYRGGARPYHSISEFESRKVK